VNVFVIGHGETEWSLSGQHISLTEVPLTDNGRRQAERMRPVLDRQTFALVLVSSLQRARETCDLVGLGAEAIVDPSLMEWNYGEYEGLMSQQIQAKRPGWLIGFPGGETPRQVGARIDQVVARAGCGRRRCRFRAWARAACVCCAMDWAATACRTAFSPEYRHTERPHLLPRDTRSENLEWTRRRLGCGKAIGGGYRDGLAFEAGVVV
jgi:Histidine phosphatase superfamily (branch 1)